MPENRLRETLDALHRELDEAREIDETARAELEHVARDIRDLLERTDPDEAQSLVDRLGEAVQAFEESHPALTAAVNRVASALSNLGI